MKLYDRISAFKNLGNKLRELPQEDMTNMAHEAMIHNGWFDQESVKKAIQGIAYLLEEEKLKQWTSAYKLEPEVPKIVGVVMAGNIPLVGFHDLLCILLSGHIAAIKLSSKDEVLMKKMIEWIIDIEPKFRKSIDIREKLDNVDAVIATGSDNTARYFEYYFRSMPNIIRKNRTAVAVLDGTETEEEIKALGNDIFSYFGLGCRNVSKIYTPKGFEVTSLFPHWESYQDIIHHHKYRNNYDYYKSIFLVNKDPHLDTGFLLLKSVDDMVSPTSVLYHQVYENKDALQGVLAHHKEKIQCVVGHGYVPFGNAQHPEPWDYADGVDVLDFLDRL